MTYVMNFIKISEDMARLLATALDGLEFENSEANDILDDLSSAFIQLADIGKEFTVELDKDQ